MLRPMGSIVNGVMVFWLCGAGDSFFFGCICVRWLYGICRIGVPIYVWVIILGVELYCIRLLMWVYTMYLYLFVKMHQLGV